MTEPVALKIALARSMPAAFGVGAYLKNALCLIQSDEAWLSCENGALDNVGALRRFEKTAQDMLSCAKETPFLFAHDWHPDFFCTRWAQKNGPRAIGVQHHHAHIAAVMAEHGLEEPVLGLALDGFGLGTNNEAWGGELLCVTPEGFTRLGHLRPLKQPGGDLAARQPWRMGAAALWAVGRGDEIADRYADFHGSAHLGMLMARNLNAPETTSAGRLFDAACGLLGVVLEAEFEGQAPMELERLAASFEGGVPVVNPTHWSMREGERLVLDMRSLLNVLAEMAPKEGAALFHATLAAAFLDMIVRASRATGVRKVVLGGGCFLNALLRTRIQEGLAEAGLAAFFPVRMPPGDGAIALGQAYAAAMAAA